ncbi:MAG: DUF4834 family protein [Prolixibacteraceae bacterium]|nr:DUF4834 family protein [Prolixibacteraceae bacterium]
MTLLFAGLVRTLFIILVIFYISRFVTRYIFPFFMKKQVRKMQSQMERQMRAQQQNKRNEGDITITYKPNPEIDKMQKEGEYVDFEEID